jgi:hypothetical protein
VKKASDFLCSSDELLEDAFGLALFDWFRAFPRSSDSTVCEWSLDVWYISCSSRVLLLSALITMKQFPILGHLIVTLA